MIATMIGLVVRNDDIVDNWFLNVTIELKTNTHLASKRRLGYSIGVSHGLIKKENRNKGYPFIRFS
jgi:hypothetical protein